MGATLSLLYRPTTEGILSRTVIYASIAWSKNISQVNAHPSRNARSVEDPTIPCPTRIRLQDPQGLTYLRSLHRLEKSPRLWQCVHHKLGCQWQMLRMMCQMIAVGPNGTSYKARALLDSGSSTSFNSEQVVQHLRLPCRHQDSKVSGIEGGTMHLSSQNFTVKPVRSGGKTNKIEALVLRKITSNVPSCFVAFDKDWKHLSNLKLADPEFGVRGSVDILIGADVFSCTVLHSQRFGPSGSPSAIKTTFSWVLAGSVWTMGTQSQQDFGCLATTSPVDFLKWFWEADDYNLQQPLLSSEERTVVNHFERNHSNNKTGRFIVPLHMKNDATPLGESK